MFMHLVVVLREKFFSIVLQIYKINAKKMIFVFKKKDTVCQVLRSAFNLC
jgi:hypothetical protein